MFLEPRFSFIIPVYNRPQEVKELLDSMLKQPLDETFEIILIEDGSTKPCDYLLAPYCDKLSITYEVIPNGGPSNARNKGVEKAKGEWLIFLDSDVILPKGYLQSLQRNLEKAKEEAMVIDFFGGPDAADDSFTPIQKAINYSMTSLLTTGGIRGKKKHAGKYCPRTYNLGCRRELFDKIRGFDPSLRFGEDMDFCLRAYKAGAVVALFEEVWVYHKRRVDFRKFAKQVYNSGIARITLSLRHPNSLHWIHLLPTVSTILFILILFLSLLVPQLLFLLLAVALLVFVDAFRQTKNWKVSLLSEFATFIQITGYGCGMLIAFWKRVILCKEEFTAFEKTFYN